MATFGGLFDFPDLSDSQSELSSLPYSSDDEHSDEYTEDEEDAWYNLSSDSDNGDNDSTALASILPMRPLLASSTALVVSTTGPKEHSTCRTGQLLLDATYN
jgi:hypothetical protein